MTTSPTTAAFMAQAPLIASGLEGFALCTSIPSVLEVSIFPDGAAAQLPDTGSWAGGATDAFAMQPVSSLLATPETGWRAKPYTLPVPTVRLDRSKYWTDRFEEATRDEGLHLIAVAFAQRDASAVKAILNFIVHHDIYLTAVLKRQGYHGTAGRTRQPFPLGEAMFEACKDMLREAGRAREFERSDRAAFAIAALHDVDLDCRSAIPLLLAPFQDGTFDYYRREGESKFWDVTLCHAVLDVVEVLGIIGGGRQELRSVLEYFARGKNKEVISRFHDEVHLNSLRQLGASEGEIVKLVPSLKPKPEFDNPMHEAASAVIASARGAKQRVFEAAQVLATLPDPQAWITINDPALAREAVTLLLQKIEGRRGALDNVLKAALGVRLSQLGEAHYTYEADEILDAVATFVASSFLREDADLQGVLSRILFGSDIRLRFVRREKEDLSLGDRCGDCTARDSINFENSLMWLVNPAYQILKLSRGKRFLGRLNLTLGTLAGKEAIIIDALEFNPQAQEGKPYYDDAKQALAAAIGYLRELAKREHRGLVAFTQSNSSEANELLKEWGEEGEGMASLRLLSPEEDVARILATQGYRGEVRLFYQMLEGPLGVEDHADENGEYVEYKDEELASPVPASGDLTDAKLPELERVVVNPAQIADPAVAAAMRARNFEEASRLILARPEWSAEVKRILGLPPTLGVSPMLLARRMEKMYAAQAMEANRLGATRLVNLQQFAWLVKK